MHARILTPEPRPPSAGIVIGAGSALAKAVTVALRYSYVRFQGFTSAGGLQEAPVIKYATQQYKPVPLLATCYAFTFVGRWMAKLYMSLQSGLESNDFSLLPIVHGSTSGLKAATTALAAAGIQDARRATGGHGFSQLGGLALLQADYEPCASRPRCSLCARRRQC